MMISRWSRWNILAALVGSGGILSPRLETRLVSYQSNSPHDLIVVAHQDDWQLFMGDVIAGRVEAGDSITFVYLTAGDNGRDSVYWLAREQAALASTAVLVGMPATRQASASCTTVLVHAHSIRKCTLGATVSWFLRLPDGKRNGAGFPRYENQSLRKLRRKSIGSISAVDATTIYHGWPDLVGTVSALVPVGEAAGSTAFHTTDPSVAINPHDHFDHRMAGLLVQELSRRQGWSGWYYVGYALSTRSANRTGEQARQKTSLFRAYDERMMIVNPKWSAYAEHPRFYSDCMVRTYARRAAGAR